MADLVRLVKMAIWIGGIEIFIGGEQMDSTFAKRSYEKSVIYWK